MDILGDLKNMQALLQNLMNSDNNVRIQSELDFKHLMESNPDSFAFLLVQTALDDSLDHLIRQSSLLHLKRMVPLYWSPAFDKFVGPNTINQDIKKILRDSLLKLISDPDSKIRSGSSYAIVQIAAVDYPDEWPGLLITLYNTTINENSSKYEVIGSLSVLQEIFDDVVTDEQFFEGGVAVEVFKTCETLLGDSKHDLEVKVETLRLLKILCQYFENVDFDIAERENFCNVVIPKIYHLLINISEQLTDNVAYITQLTSWDFKHEIYYILNLLFNSFSYLLEDSISPAYATLLIDLNYQKPIYSQLLVPNFDINNITSIFSDVEQFYSSQRERREPFQCLTITLSKEIEFLQTLIEIKSIENPEELSKILEILIDLSILSGSKIDDYNSDFNQFVTDESGLNTEIALRDSVRELLSDINANDNFIFIKLLIEKLMSHDISQTGGLVTEAIAFLLTCCFDNDDTIEKPNFDVEAFLMNSLKLIKDKILLQEDFQFLTARFILMIPKLLFKYASMYKGYGLSSFTEVCSILPSLGNKDEFLIVKSATLISLQYYNYFIRAKEFSNDIQAQLIETVSHIYEEADEDTNMMLLEVMTIIISINNTLLSKNSDTIMLILTIGFKNDSNFALNTSMFESIDDLLKDIPQANYMSMTSFVFPFLLSKISEFKNEYNSEIDLSLQVLTTFLKDRGEYQIPQDLFDSSFQIINRFIGVCDDDELLQSSSETLIELIKMSYDFCRLYVDKETNESGVQLLLKNVSKFLSPSISDRAIVKLGDLITILIKNFNSSIEQYLEDILKALIIRLVRATEVPTIENMILIFNMLTIVHPQETIQFLKSFEIDGLPALSKILPIWFQSYEVMRGYNSILSNVRAFIEIFKLNDETITQLIVDGDPLPHQVAEGIIITRSMAKRMPIKYEQIPANVKIIRLLLDELKNEVTSTKTNASLINELHGHHAHHSHDQGVDENASDEDGWEDLDDIGEPSFEQLKSYVDDDSRTRNSNDGPNEDIKLVLISFFKECTARNTGNFENIYVNYLGDAQKQLLSEYLGFI